MNLDGRPRTERILGDPEREDFGDQQKDDFGRPKRKDFGRPKRNDFGRPKMEDFGRPKTGPTWPLGSVRGSTKTEVFVPSRSGKGGQT